MDLWTIKGKTTLFGPEVQWEDVAEGRTFPSLPKVLEKNENQCQSDRHIA